MQQARLDHAPATAVLLERDGRFFVYQPGLALVASGENVEAAYRRFSEVKRAFFKEAEQAGLTVGPVHAATAGGAPRNAAVVMRRGVAAELGLFLAKTCIVLLILAGIGIAGAVAAIKAVNHVMEAAERTVVSIVPEIGRASDGARGLLKEIQAMGNISIVDIANKAAVIVQDVQAMPQERKESLRQSIAILSREAEPIIEAWRNPPPLPGSGTALPSPPATNSPGR